jgi:2-hydroxycyclohexanecarboxyl-CoA dehydrogenase
MLDLNGKVAWITGSGRGLGRAMAERFAELGAAVAVHDIDDRAPAEFGEADDLEAVRRVIADRGARALAVTGDIASADDVARMTARIEAELGPIDVLVNAAGGDIAKRGGKPKPNDALEIPLDDVRAILERNLVGTMLVCRAVCPRMRDRRRGSVVNIGSPRPTMPWPTASSTPSRKRRSCITPPASPFPFATRAFASTLSAPAPP